MDLNDKKPLLKEVDLINIIKKLISGRKIIFWTCAGFLAFGLFVAFTSVKSYKAEVVVAPEESGGGISAGGMGALAAMAGIDLGAMGGSDAIYPLLYPDIIQSLPFLTSLMDVNVVSKDGAVDTTYAYYQAKLQKKSLFVLIKKLPKKAFNWCASLFLPKEDDSFVRDPLCYDPYRLSRKQMEKILSLTNSIDVFVDKKTDVITVSFTDPDPVIAATMANEIMVRLQDRITEYRTQKAQNDYSYIEKLYLESKESYEEAQTLHAAYVDKHQGLIKMQFQVEEERLRSDMELKNTLYTQWAQQLQLSQAKIQEKTPAFTTLKPAVVPAIPSSMRKLAILFIWGCAGLFFSVLYILLKNPVTSVWHKIFE
mgnify:CR=1 FL=1